MPTGCCDVVAPVFLPLPPLPQLAAGKCAWHRSSCCHDAPQPMRRKKSSIGHQTLTRAHCWCSQKQPGPEKNRTGNPKTELAIFDHFCTLAQPLQFWSFLTFDILAAFGQGALPRKKHQNLQSSAAVDVYPLG